LYISYDGMLEPLGQSQVLAYLEKLAPGRRIQLISFEKPRDWADEARRLAMRDRLARANIAWHPLRYTKWPPVLSALWDMARGALVALRVARRESPARYHGRNMLCAAMLLPAISLYRGRLIADIRGFWADERVDGAIIRRNGMVYKVLKALERAVLRRADRIVTLTKASIVHLREDAGFGHPQAPISVIPTCVDLDRFVIRRPLEHEPFVLGYVGSVGTWYLLDEMLRCFQILLEEKPDAQLLVVNRGEQELIRSHVEAMGIAPSSVELVAADHRNMPALIGRMTAGMALIKPAYSKIASAPTKLAEYLACGVPCLGNAGVGDMEEILEGRAVGVCLSGISEGAIRTGMRRLVELAGEESVQQRCREVATELFSLEAGVESYARLYAGLACPQIPGPAC
jgi:glycosyltransferase involved in cell wall biosynthesis